MAERKDIDYKIEKKPFIFKGLPQPTKRAPKEKGEKVYFSNFMITLNTNIRPKTEEQVYDILHYLEQVPPVVFSYSNIENTLLDEFRWISYKNREKEILPKDPSKIKQLKVVYRVEIGTGLKGGREHLHVGLNVQHTGLLQVNREEVMRQVNEYLTELNSPYKIKYCNISIERPKAKDYLSK